MTGDHPRAVVPLEMRPALALRLSPRAWGGGVAAVLLLGAVAFHAVMEGAGLATGDAPADLSFATRAAVVASLSIGYTLAVWRWVAESLARDFRELGLRPVEGDPAAVHGVTPERLRTSRWAGAAGVAFFAATVEVPNAVVGGDLGTPWISLHALSYLLGLGVLFFWIAGRAAYFSIGRAQFRTVLDQLEIDLLDREPLRVFGRIGRRNALVWLTGISIGMLAFANPELRIVESLIVLVPLLLVSGAIAVAAMMLPLRGLHARIAEAKREELGRVEAAIRGDESALAGSRLADRRPPPSLADLVAYKGLVESVPEWPFDGSTLRRVGLYTLIPLLSWVGAALVERGVGRLLE